MFGISAQFPSSFLNFSPCSHYFCLVRPRHEQWECRWSTLERPPQSGLVANRRFYPKWYQHFTSVTKISLPKQNLIDLLYTHFGLLALFRTFIAIIKQNASQKFLTLTATTKTCKHSNLISKKQVLTFQKSSCDVSVLLVRQNLENTLPLPVKCVLFS